MTFDHVCTHFDEAAADGTPIRTDRAMCWHEVHIRPVERLTYDDGINYGETWSGMDLTAFLPKDRSGALHVIV